MEGQPGARVAHGDLVALTIPRQWPPRARNRQHALSRVRGHRIVADRAVVVREMDPVRVNLYADIQRRRPVRPEKPPTGVPGRVRTAQHHRQYSRQGNIHPRRHVLPTDHIDGLARLAARPDPVVGDRAGWGARQITGPKFPDAWGTTATLAERAGVQVALAAGHDVADVVRNRLFAVVVRLRR